MFFVESKRLAAWPSVDEILCHLHNSAMQPPLDNLSHDPIHGYIPFSSDTQLATGGVAERTIIDHPWVQRMRHIHQLQTAWWVYPTAEHTRFQHILGAMHLGSRAIGRLYPSLRDVCSAMGESVPSRGYVESTMRMAGLLHDVGHGPFGHFFDHHFLTRFDLTHEKLGAHIIEHELGDLLKQLRRNPNSELDEHEQLDPQQIAWLIQRPKRESAVDDESFPRWLYFLRSLLSGIYTIDNMDFVLRDAYMSGFSPKSFDLDRLLHYSFFTERGLTISRRGIGSLLRFMAAKSDLFSNVYFHRTVRGIDLALADVFQQSRDFLFPGNPLEHLDEYLNFTETTLLVDVPRWRNSSDPEKARLGQQWHEILQRRVPWRMSCQRSVLFAEHDPESSSIFADASLVEFKLRQSLPPETADTPIKIDIARHIYRPHTRGPAANQNFYYDDSRDQVRPLSDSQLFRHLPVSSRICRVYTPVGEHGLDATIAAAMDELIGSTGPDDLTNM